MFFRCQVVLLSTGLAMANSQAALATWGEGSEPGQNIDPDSTEYYNRHVAKTKQRDVAGRNRFCFEVGQCWNLNFSKFSKV